jgi:hypothetical protein
MKTKLAIIAAGLASAAMFAAPAAYASGDAPWCTVSQIGESAEAWDCQYETVEECVPHVIAGNRGNCTPNPYGPGPAAASAPIKDPASATSARPENRKVGGGAK